MTVHCDSRIVAAPPDQVFDIVADVESYPEFLPLWRDARVYDTTGDTYLTEQEVGFGPVHEHFHTRTRLTRPTRIEITSTDNVFDEFSINWDFRPIARGCRVAIALKWRMHSTSLQRAIDLLLPRAARTMVDSFERRARVLCRGAQRRA